MAPTSTYGKDAMGLSQPKNYNAFHWDPPTEKREQCVHPLRRFHKYIKEIEMLTKKMMVNTAKNAKISFQKKKWKESKWLQDKDCSVADILRLAPGLPRLSAHLWIFVSGF